ncbi:MAG: beta strand repeat-containing protein, partial [Caldilineaceae bacterium]
NFAAGTLTVTIAGADNKNVLSLVQGNGVTLSGAAVLVDGQVVALFDGDNSLQLRFSGNGITQSSFQAMSRVLRQVAYRRLPGRAPTLPVPVQWVARSSAAGSQGNAVGFITVSAVNDPPEIGLVPFSVFEDTPVNLESSLSLSDPEVQNQDIVFTATVDSGVLVFSATNGLTDSNPSTTIVRVVGRLDRLNDDSSLDLVYTPASNFGGTVNFTFALDDTGIEPPPALVTTVPYATDIVDQPDPPVLDLQANNASFDVTVGYTEQAPPVVLAPTTLITDVDSTTMNSAIVEINSFIVGSEVLTYTDSATISEGFNPGIGTLTLTGPAPTADFVALLRSVRYASSSNNPPASRTIRFVVVDDTNLPSTARTATVSITPVNDPAVLVIDPSILNVSEGAAAVLVDPTAQVTDPDTFVTTTSRLTVTVTPPVSSKDELRVRSTVGQITMRSSNTIAVFAGTDIANVAGFGTSQLRFTLLSTANPTNLTALLRAITYERKNGASVGTRSIRFDLREASLPTATASRPLEVDGANDPPVVTVTPTTVATEDTAANIATSISVTDVDSGAGALIFTVTVASGRLDFNTASPPPGVTYVSGDLTSQLVLNGSNTALTSMLTTASNLVFSPTTNFSGTVGMIVQANDQGQAPPGPVGTPPGVGTGTGFIQVRGVNDRPVITLATPTTPEDTLLNVGSSVVITDVDALNGTMRLTATVTNGTIATTVIAGVTQVSSNPTRIVVTGNITNLRTWLATSSNLRFTPVLNFSGNATLQVQLNDQGASGWPPTTPLIDDKTTTITVTPVDDAPTVTVTDAFFNEDTTTGIASRITLVDGDGSPGTVGLTVTVNVGTGVLGFGSSPGVTLVGGANTNELRLQGSLANLTTMLGVANNIQITPTLNFSGTTLLSAQARDLTSGAVGSDFGILQVRGLNDAPTASYTAGSVTVNEDTSVSLAGLIVIGDVDALSFTTRLTVSVGT